MRRRGSIRSAIYSPSADIPRVPSDKPSRRLYFEPEKLQALFDLWTELRNPGRRRRPEYIGQRLDFNPWLVQLIDERATQVQADLARADAAPISGTVERHMTTTPKTKTTSKAPKTTTSKAAEKRPIGRPPTGRNSLSRSVTLKESTWDWLDEKGGGPGTGNKVAAQILEAAHKRAK